MSSEQLLSPPDPEQAHLREERRAARMQRRREQRRAKIILWSTIGSSIVLLGLIGFISLQIQGILSFNAAHPPMNGVTCDTMEQGGYHIQVHLTIDVNGQRVTVPKGIGIATDGSCFYWLHTHTSDGILHIEAPQKQHNEALDERLDHLARRFCQARLSSGAQSADWLEDLRQWQALPRPGHLAAAYGGAARFA